MHTARREHHGREYLVAAVSGAGEYAALRYGITWLAFLAAGFFWLAVASYTSRSSWYPSLGWKRIATHLITLLVIGAATYRLALPLPADKPNMSILGYEIVLFKPGYSPFANVFFQNIAGDGMITAYSFGALALTSSDPVAVRKEVDTNLKKTIAEGNAGQHLVFSLKRQEKRWFTVFGPTLSDEESQGLKEGKYCFYFSGAIMVNGEHSPNTTFCNYVEGDKPNVILQCPD